MSVTLTVVSVRGTVLSFLHEVATMAKPTSQRTAMVRRRVVIIFAMGLGGGAIISQPDSPIDVTAAQLLDYYCVTLADAVGLG